MVSAIAGILFGFVLAGPGRLDGGPIALLMLRIGLGAATLFVVVLPLLRSAQGGSLPRERLLLLPISRRRLHLSEVAGGIGDPLLLVIVPGLVTLPLTMAWFRVDVSGSSKAALELAILLIGGGLLFLALLSLSALVAFASVALLRDRRRAQLVTLVLSLGLAGVGLFPLALDRSPPANQSDTASTSPTAGENRIQIDQRPQTSQDQIAPSLRFPAWSQGLPSEAYSRLILRSLEGDDWLDSIPQLWILAGLAVGSFWCSWFLWRYIVLSPAQGSASRRSVSPSRGPSKLPGLDAATSAVAVFELRIILRSLTGKVSLVMPLVLVVILASALDFLRSKGVPFGSPGVVWGMAAASLSLLSQTSVLLNQFSIDGAGASLLQLIPLDTRQMVVGKAAASGIVFAASAALTVSVVVILVGMSVNDLSTVVLMTTAQFLLFAPLAAGISAIFPKPADLDRMGRAAQAHDFALLLGLVILSATVSLVMTMTLVAPALLGRPGLRPLFAAVVVVLAALVARPLFSAAAAIVAQRRDALLMTTRELRSG